MNEKKDNGGLENSGVDRSQEKERKTVKSKSFEITDERSYDLLPSSECLRRCRTSTVVSTSLDSKHALKPWSSQDNQLRLCLQLASERIHFQSNGSRKMCFFPTYSILPMGKRVYHETLDRNSIFNNDYKPFFLVRYLRVSGS